MARNQIEGPFLADLRDFPLLEIRSPNVAQYDHVSIPTFFHCVDQGLLRKTHFAVLHDARAMPHVDDGRRQEFMELLDLRRHEVVRYVAAYAAIVSSPLERGLITAFMWFIKLPFPIRLFANEAEARRWLLSRVKAARETDASLAAQG